MVLYRTKIAYSSPKKQGILFTLPENLKVVSVAWKKVRC